MSGNNQEDNLRNYLPENCVLEYNKYTSGVHSNYTGINPDPNIAAEPVKSYEALDTTPECRDAIQEFARANGLVFPVRHLTPLTRTAFGAAFANDPSAPTQYKAAPVALRDDGYDAKEVLDFGISILQFAGAAANLGRAMHGATGAVSAVGGRAPAMVPNAGSNCFLQHATHIKDCVGPESNSTITK